MLDHLRSGQEGTINDNLKIMYDYLDNDNDRTYIRQKIEDKEMRQTTIKDIGETLDKFMLESKAFFDDTDLIDKDGPDLGKEHLSNHHFLWTNGFVKENSVGLPKVFDPYEADPNNGHQEKDRYDNNYSDYILQDKVVDYDRNRDHSMNSISKDEKYEMDLFKTMKRDPYFNHYIFNKFRLQAERFNEI